MRKPQGTAAADGALQAYVFKRTLKLENKDVPGEPNKKESSFSNINFRQCAM